MQSVLEQYKIAVDESSVFSKTDAKGIITYVNDAFCDLSKYSTKELIGKSHNLIRHPDTPKSTFQDMWATIKNKKIWKGIVKNLSKDGSDYYVSATIIPIMDDNDKIIEYLGVRHDITDLYKQKKIINSAMVDETTGLFSRTKFIQDIKTVETKMIVLLDIVSFHYINDFYGYETGDGLLNIIAQELKIFMKDNNCECDCYRLPIDIFAIVYKKNVKLDLIEQKINLFLEKFKAWPKAVHNTQLYVQAIAGMSLGTDQNVYQQADIALQYAKKNKKQLQLYHNELNVQKEIEKNFQISRMLNDAIFSNNVLVYFQPIIDNNTKKNHKFEALVRLKDEEGKILSPGLFLDVAKKTGIYKNLAHQIIKKSIQAAKDHPEYEISINITYEDIMEKKNKEFMVSLLQDRSVASRIVLEITETEEMKDLETVKSFLLQMKELGCQIAIDDFGSGYSNFKYLMELQADYLKIDGSLVSGLPHDKSSLEIVKAIVSFAKEMNIKTIAEYVSSEEIFNIVKELGIDYSQGFYFSPATEFINGK